MDYKPSIVSVTYMFYVDLSLKLFHAFRAYPRFFADFYVNILPPFHTVMLRIMLIDQDLARIQFSDFTFDLLII